MNPTEQDDAREYAEKRAESYGDSWNEQDVINAEVCYLAGYTSRAEEVETLKAALSRAEKCLYAGARLMPLDVFTQWNPGDVIQECGAVLNHPSPKEPTNG